MQNHFHLLVKAEVTKSLLILPFIAFFPDDDIYAKNLTGTSSSHSYLGGGIHI